MADETLVAMIRKNVRTPDQTMGDLWAQVVALDLMEDRLRRADGRLRACPTSPTSRARSRGAARRRCAARSAQLPDGTYRSELKTDGLLDMPITITHGADHRRATSISMDFTGTDAQVDRAINCALCYTYAMAMYGVKVCTNPNLPNNEGAWRPITVSAPEGCIVNPQFPALGRLAHADRPLPADAGLRLPRPGGAGARDGGLRLADVGHEPVAACGKAASPTPTCSSTTAAWAATRRATASPACPGRPTSPRPRIEISEHIAPLRFHHKRLRPDSGGPGRHRGGLGQEILIESRSETPIAVCFLAERTIFPAFGIEGGQAGAAGELRINGEKTDPKRQYVLNTGDTVLLRTPGGGGHGDPAAREDAAQRHDRDFGYVTGD